MWELDHKLNKIFVGNEVTELKHSQGESLDLPVQLDAGFEVPSSGLLLAVNRTAAELPVSRWPTKFYSRWILTISH